MKPQRPQVYWRESGSGPALVLLNGWTASGLAWPRAWVHELERSFRVIRIDNRGTGFSRFADTPFTVADLADDVAAVLDAGGHERATVLGLSMGGMIAQEFAIRYDERVEGLMLVSTRPPAPAYSMPRMLELGGLLQTPKRGERLSVYMTRLWSRAAADGFAQREPASIEELVGQIVARPTSREMLMHQLRAVSGWGHADRLAELRGRTIVVHGAQDGFIVVANGRRLAELIPGARYVELPGVGHLPSLEAPNDLLELIFELTGEGSAAPACNGRRDPLQVPSSAWR